VVLALLWILYKQWQAKQPWPDFGGRITSLHSLAEWTALLKECEDTGKVVIVDAYALWCPPCKSAAPVFAKLSEEFSEASTVFAKFNTDEAKDLARQLNISAMPTFKIFKASKEVDVQQGWPGEQKVRELLKKHGATLAKAD